MKKEQTKLTDEDLMLAYQGGDEGAFKVLYQRYSSKLYGFFQARVQNRTLTDDLFQSAFMKLHKSRHTYKKGSAFSPWMFTICRSVLSDHFRKAPLPEEVLDLERVEDVVAEPARPTISLTFDGLSEREKKAIDAKYNQDLSYSDLGTKLGTSETNARQIISRAINKLRKGVRR